MVVTVGVVIVVVIMGERVGVEWWWSWLVLS